MTTRRRLAALIVGVIAGLGPSPDLARAWDPSTTHQGLLESAVMTPRSTYDGAFLLDDISQMAAAYLFHIVRNHPFVDGNKRTGTAAALVFLDLNGVEVDADDDSLVALVLDVAQGHADRGVVAEFLRSRIVPR